MKQLWQEVLETLDSACAKSGNKLSDDQKIIIAGVLAMLLRASAKRG